MRDVRRERALRRWAVTRAANTAPVGAGTDVGAGTEETGTEGTKDRSDQGTRDKGDLRDGDRSGRDRRDSRDRKDVAGRAGTEGPLRRSRSCLLSLCSPRRLWCPWCLWCPFATRRRPFPPFCPWSLRGRGPEKGPAAPSPVVQFGGSHRLNIRGPGGDPSPPPGPPAVWGRQRWRRGVGPLPRLGGDGDFPFSPSFSLSTVASQVGLNGEGVGPLLQSSTPCGAPSLSAVRTCNAADRSRVVVPPVQGPQVSTVPGSPSLRQIQGYWQ